MSRTGRPGPRGGRAAPAGSERPGFAAILCAALPVLLALSLGACGSGSPPPNVVVVVLDALRPDHTGAYGYALPSTPNLDRLAAESILFEDAVAPAAFTLPSVATLFTGLSPLRHGVRRHLDPDGIQDHLEAEQLTLAERLEARGYATGAVVSNSLFLLKNGFDQGFDHFDAGRRRDAGPTTDQAIAWLEQQPKDRPFFLWVHYIDAHWPYDAPAGSARPFHHDDQGEFAALLAAFKAGKVRGDQIYFENRLGPDGVRAGIAEYDNEIAYLDRHLGRLLEYLKARGDFENTLIAVVSDHGESLGEHGLCFAHSFYLYDEVMRVVFLLKPPGACPPCRVKQPVRLLDFLPTALPLLGLPADPAVEGVDLQPWWESARAGVAPPRADLPAYGESEPRYRTKAGLYRYPARKRAPLEGNAGKWRMLREGMLKLIRIPGEGWELYDLGEDPKEARNLAQDPSYAARMEALRRELEGMIQGDLAEPVPPDGASREASEADLRELRALGYGY